MKILKLLSFILVLSMMTSMFFACDTGDAEDDIDIPERELHTVTVAFQIKDQTGKTVIDVPEYTYKGHAEPTILNVLDTYLSVVADWTCKIDKYNTITQIGGMKANKNNADYWGFVTNVTGELTEELTSKRNGDADKNIAPQELSSEEIKGCFQVKTTVDKNGNETVVPAVGLSLEQIKKSQSDGAMKDAFLVDGAQFTVILFVSED